MRRFFPLVWCIASINALFSCDIQFKSPLIQASLSSSHNIFFIRVTNETSLTTVELCALQSAVAHNPGMQVRLFSNNIPCDYAQREIGVDISIIRYNAPDVLNAWPALEAWYDSRVWDVPYWAVHLSDSIRLVLLYRYGGVYLDTDMLSLATISTEGENNFIGLEDPWVVNNAVLGFSSGHPFLAQAMSDFVASFRPDFWGWNGPRLVTRIWMNYIGGRLHNDILLAPVMAFYPVSWRDWEVFFRPTTSTTADQFFAETRAIHMWSSLSSSRIEAAIANSSGVWASTVLLGHIFTRACPNLIRKDKTVSHITIFNNGIPFALPHVKGTCKLDSIRLKMQVWNRISTIPVALFSGGVSFRRTPSGEHVTMARLLRCIFQ